MLGLVAGTSVPAKTEPAPTGPWRRSLQGGRELFGASGLSRRFHRSVIHPTRLETRTKESNTCASLRVIKPGGEMKVSRSTAGRSPAGVRLGRRRRRELFSAGSSPGRALAAVPVAETVSRVAAVPFRGGGGSSSGRRGGGGLARAYHLRGAGRGLVTSAARATGRRGLRVPSSLSRCPSAST